MTPEILVRLANLGQPRRPGRAPARLSESVLADPVAATRQLEALIPRPVREADLPALRHLHQVVVEVAEELLEGRPLDFGPLNAMIRASTAHLELVVVDGSIHYHLVWDDPSIAAGLARRLAEEIAAMESSRLRRCARSECPLLFYDTTRSRTQRWHAEDPCGWRERQRHRRARS